MDSIFSSQMQATMMQLMMKLMEKYMSEKGTESSNDENTTSSTHVVDSEYSGSFSDLIQAASSRYQVDADLIAAVIQTESNFNSSAVSPCGAMGLMQLMPGTASSLGVSNAMDPAQNIDGGVRYLKQMLDTFQGNTSLALAAYNAGPGAVSSYGGIPPYQETQQYVQKVLQIMG